MPLRRATSQIRMTDTTPPIHSASAVAIEATLSNSTGSTLEPSKGLKKGASSRPDASNVRVLHLINGEHFAGAERVQDLLAIGLPDRGFDVEFACLKRGSFADCRKSVTAIHFTEMKSRFDLTVSHRIQRIVEDNGIAVIHAHTPRSAMIASRVAKRTGIPFVYHVHSPTSRDSTRRIINWLNQRVEKQAIRSAQALITVSGSLKQHIERMGAAPGKVHVVRNGVANREIMDRLPPKSPWMLGTIALFRPRKGTEVLLHALKLLRDRDVDVRLLAVGGFETTEYEKRLREAAMSHRVEEMIEWTGFCKDVDSQLKRMDALVLPSLFGEGLPMVILEAMASGVPVIASSVEGVPEAITDQTDGLLARPSDPEDLALRIEELVSGEYDWDWLRNNAFERQRNEFSTQSMARGVAEVYRSVLDR